MIMPPYILLFLSVYSMYRPLTPCSSSSSTSCGLSCRVTRAGAKTHLLSASEKKQSLLLWPPAKVALTSTASGANDCKYER